MMPTAPRIYATDIRHVRVDPMRNDFHYRSYSWLVDLDALPELGPVLGGLTRFEARDHLGAPDRTLRENLDAFLATEDVDLRGGRILMLTNPRVLRYVFNPITVYWCYTTDQRLECVVLEVHNTYGERHAYLVRTDAAGRAQVPKQLYVSPFNEVDGHYDLVLPEPAEQVRVSVTLRREGRPPFVAVLHGRARPASTAYLLRTALTRPLEPLLVMTKIRWQGVRLWARGLPVQTRPKHQAQEAVQ